MKPESSESLSKPSGDSSPLSEGGATKRPRRRRRKANGPRNLTLLVDGMTMIDAHAKRAKVEKIVATVLSMLNGSIEL